MSNADELRREFANLFHAAENKIKEHELTAEELVIPAVNQLRYAGYHLAKSFSSTDENVVEEQLKKSINHCKRAYFDTCEVMMLDYLGIIQDFKKNHAVSPFVLDVLPDYTNLIKDASKTKREIIQIRDGLFDERTEMFELLNPHIEKLRDHAETIDTAIPILSAKNEQYRDEKTTESRRFIFKIALTILGIGVTFFGILSNRNSETSRPHPLPASSIQQNTKMEKISKSTEVPTKEQTTTFSN